MQHTAVLNSERDTRKTFGSPGPWLCDGVEEDPSDFQQFCLNRLGSALTGETKKDCEDLYEDKCNMGIECEGTAGNSSAGDPLPKEWPESIHAIKRGQGIKEQVSGKRLRKTLYKGTHRKFDKKVKDDLYSVDNVVFLAINRGRKCSKISEPKKEMLNNSILIPEFKALDDSYYYAADEAEPAEDESDSNYEEMHRPYELAESCHNLLSSGQDLPEAFRGGLKVKLRLPKNNDELPSIIQ